MNYVPNNPNRPICPDCEREFDEELGSVIHPGLDVWCAKKRIAEENAELAAEAAADPEAFIAATIIASIPKARELLGDQFFKPLASTLLSDTEPLFSAERDSRVSR